MLSLNASENGVCNNFIHLSSVSNRLMYLNLVEELESYSYLSYIYYVHYSLAMRATWMTGQWW